MTLTEIQDRVTSISTLDSERAHQAEDELYHYFIHSLLSRNDVSPEVKAQATLVLTTQNLEFSRWYA